VGTVSPRALLTGATGFLGARLARALDEAGWEVTALGRARGVGEMADTIRRARPDVTLHLATEFRAEHTPDDIEPMIAANVLFGTQLLESLRAVSPARVVTVGTHWQHYDNAGYSPVSLYAATKQAFDDIARYYTDVAGFQIVHLDVTDCYGPGDTRGKLLSLLCNAAREGWPLDLSPGEQQIDLLHVDDAVSALLIAAERLLDGAAQPAERWAVRTGRSLTIREVVALFERVRGVTLDVRWGARPYRARETFAAWTEGSTLPGWVPRIPLERGLLTLE
jgi:nucleoside-diphosphate-sugar epimerase